MKPHLGDTLQLDGGVRGKSQMMYVDNNHVYAESKGID